MHVVSVDEGEHSEEAARGEWHPQRPAPGVARRGCVATVSRRAGDRAQGLIDHRPVHRLIRNVHAASWLVG